MKTLINFWHYMLESVDGVNGKVAMVAAIILFIALCLMAAVGAVLGLGAFLLVPAISGNLWIYLVYIAIPLVYLFYRFKKGTEL